MTEPRTFVRPMTRWWQRDPYFVRYMWREATAIGVAVYAVVLALGALRLAQGEAAWNAWLDALRSPLSLALHGVLLLSMAVHAQSWFQIMPKTLPALRVGGRRVSARAITGVGWAGTLVATLLILAVARWG